jgi:chromosome segregation ATPase
MKTYILGIIVSLALFSCGTQERERLQTKVDSLNQELAASKQVEREMNEVGALIDSIDANRKALEVKMIEGKSTYGDYVGRLQAINTYVKQTEAKIAELEKSSSSSKRASAGTIRRLKADLEKSTKEIVDLQLQLATARDENLQ